MDTALMAPLAAPPAPSASRAGEAAGAAAASDAPAFAAALADADQTLHDTSAPDADPSAPSDAGTEATTDEAAEPSLPANDTVTQTQQSLADMAAMLASLNATPTSLPVVAVASTAPELSAANLDAAEQPGTEGAVEDTLPSANLAADARPNALPLTPAQIAPSGGEAAAQAAPRRATPPARSADATATSASQRLTHGRDGVTPLRNEVNTTSTPGSVPDAAMAPATDTVAPASAAPATATATAPATATATATAAVANTTSTTTSTTTTAGTSASLVASDTAALPAPAAPTLSTGVQGVAAREPNTRSRVASLAFQTASAPRAAAPGEPTGGDIGAAAQRSETNSAGAPPPQFSWVNAPANPSANAPGNWAGARVSSEPAFQAQLSAQLFSSDFAPALGVQISTLTRNGIPEARLHLNPAELGPIAVQIELDGRTAQVVLSASHAETRLVLEQAMPQLASAMRDAGFSMSGGGVFQQPQQREPRANDGTPQSARNGVDTALAPPTTTLARVQRGVVDVYA